MEGDIISIKISGQASVNYTPANICTSGGGTYTFETITPYKWSNDTLTEGHITINRILHFEAVNSKEMVWYDANGNGSRDANEVITDNFETNEDAMCKI